MDRPADPEKRPDATSGLGEPAPISMARIASTARKATGIKVDQEHARKAVAGLIEDGHLERLPDRQYKTPPRWHRHPHFYAWLGD
jgi:hypothetical protein